MERQFNDEFLLKLAIEGNQESFTVLHDKYKKYGRTLIKEYLKDKKPVGLTFGDFESECERAFLKTILSVDFTHGNSMYPLFKCWCLSYFSDLFEEESKFYLRQKPANIKSLDSTYIDETEDMILGEFVGEEDADINGSIKTSEIRDAIVKNEYQFTIEEQTVMLLFLDGCSKKEVSNITGFSRTKVENVLNSSYFKARKLFDAYR